MTSLQHGALPFSLARSLKEIFITGFDIFAIALVLLVILTLFAGITMVSNVKFYSGKDINLRKSVPFRVLVIMVLSVVALMQVANNLPELLFSLFAIYGASGYAMWAWAKLKKKPPMPPHGAH